MPADIRRPDNTTEARSDVAVKSSVSDALKPSELIRGAIDCYVHANPDLLPRRVDDVQLAHDCSEAGLAAALHRHHFCSTAERSALARNVTGFAILGAVLLNDSVGGLNPTAVELALQMGAPWVGLPTLSARSFRSRIASLPPAPGSRFLEFGPGRLQVWDSDGSLLPEVVEILRLVREGDAVLNLGYIGNDEMLAVARAAAEMGHARLVITNARVSDVELEAMLAIPGLFFEVTSYGVHPDGLGGDNWESGMTRNAQFIRQVGIDRVLVSSDGGMAGSPPPAEILRWALDRYAERGFSASELRVLVQENPRRLLPRRCLPE
jgi:hypothetical protein